MQNKLGAVASVLMLSSTTDAAYIKLLWAHQSVTRCACSSKFGFGHL